MITTLLRALACVGTLVFALPQLSAQASTGAISGRVVNSSTRQFLSAAEVKVIGTNVSVLTDRDGSFTLTNLAPGSYNLEISYTGLDPEKRTVNVEPGRTAREEFNLTRGLHRRR